MTILGLGAVIIYELSQNDVFSAIMVGLCMIPALGASYLARRKRLEIAAAFWVMMLISLITILATKSHGIHQVSVLAYLIVLIVASLVIRKRALVFLILYTTACIAWLIFGEYHGAYIPVAGHNTPEEIVIAVIVLVSIAFFVRLFTRAMFQNNLRLQKEIRERKLHEEHIRYQSNLLKNISDAIISSDLKSKIASWNQAAEALYGWEEKEVIGKPVNEILKTEYLNETAEQIRQRLLEQGLWRGEVIQKHKDGTRLYIMSSLSVVLDENGQPMGALAVNRDITDHKRVEEALRLSEEGFRMLAENLPDSALFLYDKDLRFIIADGPEIEATGYSRETLEGRTLQEALPPDFAGTVEPNMRRALAGDIFFAELPFEDRYYRYSYLPLRDRSGDVLLGLILATNITEHKRMEERHWVSEERLQQAIQVSNMGIFDHDHKSDFIYWSPEQRKHYGIDLDEPVTLEKFLSQVHPHDREKIGLAVKRAYDPTGDGLFDMEHRIIRRDGTVRWLSTRSRTFFEREGKATRPVRTVGAVIDITERVQAEDALRESKEMSQFFIRYAPAAIAMLDRDMRYIAVSNRWISDYHVRESDIIGKSHYEIFPEIPDQIKEVHKRGFSGEVIKSDEDRFERADGSIQWLRWEMRPWHAADGSIGGLVIFSEDISERKQAEEKLRENEAQLSLIFNSTSDSQVLLRVEPDDRFVVQAANNAYLKALPVMFPHTSINIIGRDRREYLRELNIPDELIEAEMLLYRAAVEQHSTIQYEVELPSVAGMFTMEVSLTPVLDRAGHCTHLLWSAHDITKRKQAENELRVKDNAIETSFNAIAMAGPDGTLTYVNPAFVKMWGLEDKEEAIGRSALTFWKDPQQAAQVIAAMHENDSWSGEMTGTRKDGSPFDLLVSANVVRDKNNQLTHLMASFVDVTERKQIEEALKDSQFFLQKSQSVAQIGSYYFDAQTGNWIGSPALDELFGIDENYSKNIEGWIDLVHPDFSEEMQQYLSEHVLTNHNRFEKEYQIVRHNDLQERWVFGLGEVEFDKQGKPVKMIGTIQDITERKWAQKRLVESEQKYRQLIEALQEGIWVIDQAANTTFVNSRMAEMLGFTAEEMMGKHLFTFMDERGVRIAERNLERRQKGISEQHDFEFMKKDGSRIYVALETAPITDEKGNYTGAIAGAIDITERKRMEEILFEEKERAQVTLNSIGDAVITTDVDAKVEFLNPVAEELTGWKTEEAVGQPLSNVFRIIEEVSRQPAISPVERCLQEERVVGLTNYSVLISRDGKEYAIDDSAAPIRNRQGETIGVVLVFHDVTEERRLSRQVAHDAMHDSLTGLVNRREFERRLERALMNTKEHNSSHILCYLDLDQFKIVNDTAGHAAGDELLRQISGFLGDLFRQRDTFARLGGDEFGLLLENCELEQALVICTEIKAKIRDFPFVWAGHGFQVGVSIGVVPITDEKHSVHQLLSQADVACYSAKDLGRDRIFVYQAEDSDTTQRHREIIQAARMREATFKDQFRLFSQPIVQLKEGQSNPPHHEVLLRMVGNDEHLLLPTAFIPSAERYGLMPAIDRWVIRETLLTLARHGIKEMLININLSGNSLDDETLLEYVLEQLDEFSIPPDHICFEITETAAIHHLSKAQEFIHAFRERGGKIALDDFGSGFSSFRYLKTLPVDYIKIDGGFVSDMLSNPGDLLMVEAITQIAHTLKIQVIAEHTSSQEIIDHLCEIGVDLAQGFAIGFPVSFDAALETKTG